ncbi:hypothetical protein SAY87_005785 [Trapa incisa]|uniref:CTLH domain-containing protein n=1 Tax=Trapa incisa TaxID=236973 RepID=A0AAN7Q7M0_9MYRT|nr:hypothetical protein SAY87_005785 [Trapa incisa]
MDTTPVNWESLDALVVDFARSENLIEDSSAVSTFPPSSPSSIPCSISSSSSYQSRLVNLQIRRSLEVGDMDAAIELLRSRAPSILEDRRILFRLQKQKFIELLRRENPEDRKAAMECLRTALAPCALDAYPEAYEEFKHILLALVYDKNDGNSPVANEWSEMRRLEIAGLMSSVLRAHLHAYDPLLSMTLRYLISIHKEYCLRQGVSSPISDLNERLLLEERDPPPTLQESFYEAPPFDEVDIQALAHAVVLTRQGAIESLRFAKGDLFMAFQNELCRSRLDIPLLDYLVQEYCIYRGIVNSSLPLAEMQNVFEPSKVAEAASITCLSRGHSLEVESAANRSPDAIIISSPKGTSYQNKGAVANVQSADAELRYPCEPTIKQEICSTSSCHQSIISSFLQKNRSHRAAERGKRKRWRGRNDELLYLSGTFSDRSSKSELRTTTSRANTDILKEKKGSEKKAMLETRFEEDKFEFILEMKELANRGMAAEVVEEVNALYPDFFEKNHVLLFQLKQVQFLNLVKSGDHNTALEVACSHLGPLAAKDSSLLKPLKETLLELIQPTEEGLQRNFPLDALSNSLQVAIGERLGIEEPHLMKIIKATIHTHNEWFKLQMCKDRFESFLRIDSLKDVSSPMQMGTLLKSNADSCTLGSSVITTSSSSRAVEDGSSPVQVSSTDAFYDETAILKVMEFLALPRADAIHLLAQYNGNAETVIEQLFT